MFRKDSDDVYSPHDRNLSVCHPNPQPWTSLFPKNILRPPPVRTYTDKSKVIFVVTFRETIVSGDGTTPFIAQGSSPFLCARICQHLWRVRRYGQAIPGPLPIPSPLRLCLDRIQYTAIN